MGVGEEKEYDKDITRESYIFPLDVKSGVI